MPIPPFLTHRRWSAFGLPRQTPIRLDPLPLPFSLSLSLCFFVLFWLVELASSFLVLSYLMKWIFYYVCVYIIIWIWVLILNFLDLCSCFWSCAYVEIWVCVLGFVLLCFWSCANVQIWGCVLELVLLCLCLFLEWIWVDFVEGDEILWVRVFVLWSLLCLYFVLCSCV